MNLAAGQMDRMYRRQRHIYDATRKFYLLGRDRLIADLQPDAGQTVLEIGCGTARNLICAARAYPKARCFGIDVSAAMLVTAHQSIAREGLSGQIAVAWADATSFDPAPLFAVAQFDRVFVSYALSMIPPWRDALLHAASLVAPGGSLHIVDFADCAGLPGWFRRALFAWLRAFSVAPRRDLPAALAQMATESGMRAVITPMFRGYAVQAMVSRGAG